MIPSANGFLEEDFEIEEQPSLTYAMDIDEKTIVGEIDELEAMKQVIFKILSTERYQYIIYSWDYGIELMDLFGEPIPYVIPELERRITEALTWDSRILSVDAFSVSKEKNKVIATFTVHTIFGDIETVQGVNI